jgi:DMSO/TMAO reductase YedYZ heme-binding membrane subunit
VSAKGEGSTGRAPGVTLGGGRRGYQVARPRSNTWLWILNAIVIGFVVIAAFLASTGIGQTVAAASYHFMLYYMGVLALVALTAEVGIGLVCTDRIFMRPAGRVTMQAIHRATGFGSIAFLISHIILEIMASRATVLDAVIPFLYPSGNKAFYLGLGTLASDMFIFIMVIGVYRARLATRMSPTGWRVLHASAYVAWIFGLVHGLLAGRPAKAFFGYEGFVYWSYGFCVVAVALALVVRFAAKDRARNELSDQVVAESPPGASLSSAAALTSMGMSGGGMTATALTGAPHAAGALEGGRPGAAARGGRTQLALPAGQGSGSGRTGRFPATTRLGQTAQFGRTGAFDQFGADHPSGPLPQVDQFGQVGQFGADHPSGPLPQVGLPIRNQPAVPAGQRDWHAAYERPMGVRRAEAPVPRYEQTGEIDRSGAYQPPPPDFDQRGPAPRYEHPSGAYQQQRPPEYDQRGPAPRYEHPSGAYQQQQRPPEYDQRGPAPRYEHPADYDRSGSYGPPPDYPVDRSGQFERSYDREPAAPYHGSEPYARPEQYGPPAGYDQSGPYQRPVQYEPPMGYDMAPPARRPYAGPPPQADPRYGSGPYQQPPAGYAQPGPYQQPPAAYDPRDQYTRPGAYDEAAQFERERADHYNSFAEQDASYTQPRPPAARGHYNPQDETDPLNISAVNTGYRP